MVNIYPDEGLETDRRENGTERTESKRRKCISVGGEKAPQHDNVLHCVATECTLENKDYYVFAVCVGERERDGDK